MQASRFVPALVGGLFIGVLSALPIVSAGNICCCLWVIGGGVVAAYLMQQSQPSPIALADGALGGLLAGIVGAFVYVLVAIPVHYVTAPLQRRMVQTFLERARDVPPELRSVMAGLSAGLTGVVVGFLVMLVAGAVLATMGGVLGALLFRRRAPEPAAPAG